MHHHRLLMYGRNDALPAAYGQERERSEDAYDLNQYFYHGVRCLRLLRSTATAIEQGAAMAITPIRVSLNMNMAAKMPAMISTEVSRVGTRGVDNGSCCWS